VTLPTGLAPAPLSVAVTQAASVPAPQAKRPGQPASDRQPERADGGSAAQVEPDEQPAGRSERGGGVVQQPVWGAGQNWIEVRLLSRPWVVRVLDLEVRFAAAEELPTGVSAKFRPDGKAAAHVRARRQVLHCWTDQAGDYALALAVPRPVGAPEEGAR
jgi:hypothetical protein